MKKGNDFAKPSIKHGLDLITAPYWKGRRQLKLQLYPNNSQLMGKRAKKRQRGGSSVIKVHNRTIQRAKGTYQLYIVYPNTEIVANRNGPHALVVVLFHWHWTLGLVIFSHYFIAYMLIIAHRKLGFIIFFLFWIFFLLLLNSNGNSWLWQQQQ